MMYAQNRGTYFVQLEDDVLSKKGFVTTMRTFALQKTIEKVDWFMLDFCQLGFIGKNYSRNFPVSRDDRDHKANKIVLFLQENSSAYLICGDSQTSFYYFIKTNRVTGYSHTFLKLNTAN